MTTTLFTIHTVQKQGRHFVLFWGCSCTPNVKFCNPNPQFAPPILLYSQMPVAGEILFFLERANCRQSLKAMIAVIEFMCSQWGWGICPTNHSFCLVNFDFAPPNFKMIKRWLVKLSWPTEVAETYLNTLQHEEEPLNILPYVHLQSHGHGHIALPITNVRQPYKQTTPYFMLQGIS